ncbi:MAG: hypothetical protein KGJ09_06710 [Candidatus Omnitrophica bacterium]|nr:hypothetical protein [Candidatus Omnitrophota bacterium]MDE2009755.1 hypothetical protein [Candidatus Omnitrophota bacterium]
MKLASIREFRSSLAEYGKEGEMVLVTNHGKMVGCFLPLEESAKLPIELKKEFVAQMGGRIASALSQKKVTEKEILDDFKVFKKRRSRQ